MTTNAHILALNDRICTARAIVRALPDSTEKEALLVLFEDALDHLMEANTDMANAARKVVMLSDQITSLNRAIYEPVMTGQVVYPSDGDYNAVREYVENRKEKDSIFKNYCAVHSRKELCSRLTDIFGWAVDDKSYGRNLLRH